MFSTLFSSLRPGLLAALALLAHTAAAQEVSSLIVTITTDTVNNADNQTSLREAITYANSFSDGLPHTVTFSNSSANGSVNFHDGTARTITLGGSDLLISGYVTIDGPGANRLSISGNNASRVFSVDTTGVARLTGLRITGGNGNGSFFNSRGGGIFNRGTLTLYRCFVTGNSASITGCGLYLGNPSTMQSTTYILESLIGGNSGSGAGAISQNSGMLCLVNSTLAGNTVSSWGGGLSMNGGLVSLVNTTITGNSSGTGAGGLDIVGTVHIRNTVIAGNSGPFTNVLSNGTNLSSLGYNLIGSTNGMSNFTSATGDQIGVAAPLLGTLQDNGGPTATVALLPGSPAIHAGVATVSEIQAVTVRGSAGTFTLTVGGQSTGALAYNASAGTVQAALEGLSNVGTGNVSVFFGGGTYTLRYHGGTRANTDVTDLSGAGAGGATVQTQTILQGGNITTDQRGKARAGAVDMGAVESQGYTLTATSGTPQSTTPGTAFSQPLVATITPNDANDPVNGGMVTFTSQGTTATATLATSPATISGGQASVTATANGTAGSYTVSATTTGAAAAVTYSLTNAETPSLVVTTTSDTVNNTDGQTSLREAITYANNKAGFDTITFNIDNTQFGPPPHVIHVATALPSISTPMMIDGLSEPDIVGGVSPIGNPTNDDLAIQINASASIFYGLLVNGSGAGTTIRGLSITGFGSSGAIHIQAVATISSNYIGVAADGITAGGNNEGIVAFSVGPGSLIGGPNPGDGNVIAHTTNSGVSIIPSWGVTVQGNTIRNNGGKGILCNNAGTGNRFQENLIYGNGSLGIDLANVGVTANDANDSDGGSNNLQNFPVLTAAASGSATSVIGSLTTQAGTYTLEFYSSPANNAQGEKYLGRLSNFTVATTGVAQSFTVSNLAAATVGHYVTATAISESDTATSDIGDTSEFSAGLIIATMEPPSLVVTTVSDASTSTDGQTSLREAITYANSFSDGLPHTVTFSNSGANGAVNFHDGTARTITLGGTELVISGYVTIDGPGAARLSISGNNASRVLYVTATGVATLNDLSITGGNGVGAANLNFGGGISSRGTLSVTRCVVTANTALFAGGGIFSGDNGSLTATLYVIDSLLHGNSGGAGGGADSRSGQFCLINSTVANNTGSTGGLSANAGQVTAVNSTITGNVGSTSARVGGVSDCFFTARNTILAGNSGTRPDFAYAQFISLGYNMIGDTTGASLNPPATGDLRNLAGNLGTLQNNGGPTFTCALLPGSPAIHAGSPTVSEIQSITVRGSSGTFTLTVGGQTTAPLAYNSSAATVQSALEGLSTMGAGNVNVRLGGGTYTLQYHVGALANATVPDISAAGSGGATAQARTILQGGSNTMADQRGKTRSGAADMGAVETQGFTLTASGGTPQVTTPGTAFSQPLVATITPNDPNDPVDGGKVTFTSQGTTATATLATSPATISGGQASVTATANGTAGSYTVSATTTGAAAAVTYSLTNAEASSLTVTTTSDTSTNTDNQTSLREALAYAATLTGSQTITFSNSAAGGAVNFHDGTARTITLNGTELAITSDITLTGPGADVLALSGGQQSRVLNFEAGVAATLRGVKVTDGKNTARDNGYGGGIFNAGTLRVENCVISGNTTAPTTVSGSAASYGGGIYSSGPLTLIQCTVAGNESTHPQGIELGTYNVQGAGIWCGANLEVTGTTISDNEAALSGGTGDINGGGIFFVGIRMTVLNSTISGNSVLVGSGVSNGHGGGVFVRDGMADFIQCTMAGNSARSGGGVAFGTAILQQNVRFRNCVIAGNLSTSTPGTSRYSPEVYPYHTSLGYNLVGDSSNSFGWIATDILDPAGGAKLGPLQNNGGLTLTHALLAGSPAIDAGDPAFDPNTFTPPLTTDQRGAGFARVIKGLSASPAPIIDIGAFESPITQYPEIVLYAGSHSLAPELSDGQVAVVNFGSTAPNVASTRNFLVRNTGDAPLDITTITVPSGYLTNGAATTLAPGASCVFQVALESSISNTYVGSIAISSSDPNEAAFDFPIAGTVVAPGSDPVVNVGENIAVQGATGSAVLGGPVGSTLYQFVGSPAMNPGGVLASAVQIRHADASLHTGMMVGQPMVLIATDTQTAPSLPGVNHYNFGPPVINETGHIAFTGEVRGAGITTNVNSRCLFSNASDGALKLVARTGTSVGLGSNLKTIGNFSIGGDLVIFLGTLVDKSIVLFGWDANTGLRPLMRNGQSLDANGITKTVKSFSILETGNASSGHGREFSVAPTGESLVTFSVVFTDNTQAVVVGSFDGTSDTSFGVTYATSQQLADSHASPGVIPQARWSTFRSAGFDNTGTYYGFISQMVANTLAGVTSTNNVGVFVDTAPGVLTLQLRENDVAPGTSGFVFSDFSDLVLGGGDYEFLVKGQVRGSGVVTNVNDKGLWAQHATNGLVLVAREGSEAPGVTGSAFFRLTQIALPGTAQPMFQATMKTGVGGVTTANDTGLWVINESGVVKLAVREGDTLDVEGTPRTVTAITALLNGTTTGGALGRRVFLADGQLTLLLTFSGGVQAHARVVVP